MRDPKLSPKSLAIAVLATLLLLLSFVAPAVTSAASARHAMVVAEQELAAKIGLQIMARGGNAVDAAVATSLAVGLTNPSSCGIGGGGFMLIYWARTNKVYALDYRERAGALATPGLYIRDGKPIDDRTRNGAMAVAVPGEINGLYNALHRFGTMQFSDVAAPTIALGRNGFPCGKHLADEIERTRYALAADPELKKVFLHSDGTPRKEGETIVEADLAHTLQTFDNHPISHFYHGPVARNLVNYLRPLGGVINIADLDDYKVYWREPLHHSYRGYDVYSMPPPSSGGATVLESLAALSPGNIAGLGLNSPAYLARLIEILRQGFADRALFGDPNFVDVPIGFLLSPQHISEMRARAFGKKSPPPAPVAQDHGTSQLCVVDEQGNVVSITTTINTPFGAKLMVPKLGIILNNEMDDFGLSPDIGNAYGLRGSNPNAIGPGKRPVSSMSPTIVLRDHHPVLTLGGSGGPTIISGTLQVALAILDAHLDPERAVKLPRIHEQGSPDTVAVEAAMPNATIRALMKMGYKVKIVPMLGAVQAIEISPQLLRGAFDPRKGGGAVGY